MFYHQKVARVRVFADIQNFALRARHSRRLVSQPPRLLMIPKSHQGAGEREVPLNGVL